MEPQTDIDTPTELSVLAVPAVLSADAPPAADSIPDASAMTDEPPAPLVPLARLQGVQRLLAQAQRDLLTSKVEVVSLRETVSAAEKRAASEYAERLRVTEKHIVPQLILGDTIAQVDQSLANSKAAFSAAQQAYARLLPTPARVGSAAPLDADQTLTPLQLLRAGLSQPIPDINK